MQVIAELIRNIVIIILLTTFLDMLLPSGNLRPYVKVIMGLFVIVSLLAPLGGLFMSGQGFAAAAWTEDGSLSGFRSVFAQSGRLSELNEQMVNERYAEKTARQIEALLQLVRGISAVSVALETEAAPGLAKQAGRHENIREIAVSAELVADTDAKTVETEIREALARFYFVKSEQVKVTISHPLRR